MEQEIELEPGGAGSMLVGDGGQAALVMGAREMRWSRGLEVQGSGLVGWGRPGSTRLMPRTRSDGHGCCIIRRGPAIRSRIVLDAERDGEPLGLEGIADDGARKRILGRPTSAGEAREADEPEEEKGTVLPFFFDLIQSVKLRRKGILVNHQII